MNTDYTKWPCFTTHVNIDTGACPDCEHDGIMKLVTTAGPIRICFIKCMLCGCEAQGVNRRANQKASTLEALKLWEDQRIDEEADNEQHA